MPSKFDDKHPQISFTESQIEANDMKIESFTYETTKELDLDRLDTFLGSDDLYRMEDTGLSVFGNRILVSTRWFNSASERHRIDGPAIIKYSTPATVATVWG